MNYMVKKAKKVNCIAREAALECCITREGALRHTESEVKFCNRHLLMQSE